MIASLRGRVCFSDEKQIIIETSGVGFTAGISARDAVRIPPEGEEVFLYTYMSVREDEISLYGFLEQDDLAVFKLMIGVSGIGPKAALGILSILSAQEIYLAVIADDSKTIAKAPGVGPKTAKKLILELKDKVDDKLFDITPSKSAEEAAPEFNANKEEAAAVLSALGFSRSEAMQAIRGAELTPDMDVDQIITAALKERR